MRFILFFLMFNFSCLGIAQAQQETTFTYKVGIIGNPARPDTRYDDQQLEALKNLGFNTVQLNIAWGSRPADEPLNLEDILYWPGIGDQAKVDSRLAIIKARAKAAKKWGFRTIFHFGAPRVDSLYKIANIPEKIDKQTEINSAARPEIVDKYRQLLQRLHNEIPEIDDILVYTFDQEAWIANEFGDGATDRDIPLHERLPPFLTALTESWARIQPKGMLWWEPWELSAGQIYACIPQLPTQHFGLALHSNIAEVQMTRPVDVWFRNMVTLLTQRDIPVIGEIFMASANEELEPLQQLAAPRLAFQQVESLYNLKHLTGIKEYYGLLPDSYDPNLLMSGLKLTDRNMTLKNALDSLVAPYGNAAPLILEAWEASALALELFPWDCSWNLRRFPKRGYIYHRWDKAFIPGSVAASPSWKSTRRALFMITENEQLHPWFYEDVGLRCEQAADQLEIAGTRYESVLAADHLHEEYNEYIKSARNDVETMYQATRALQYYCREINLAFLMRKYVAEGIEIPHDLLTEFRTIVTLDAENQEKSTIGKPKHIPSSAEMLKAFNDDPKSWLNEYLLH